MRTDAEHGTQSRAEVVRPVPDPVPRLLSHADALAKGAELAAEQGDMAAFVELITAAAQLVRLARLLETPIPSPLSRGGGG